MSGLAYARAASLESATEVIGSHRAAEVIAGGTDLLQRLEEHVLPPPLVVDINGVEGLRAIEVDDHEIRLGALVRLNQVIESAPVRDAFPAIVEALIVTASPQVRNLATVGGNPLQKTRCLYFRDQSTPCNKREPGSGCGALEGRNRINAILGGSEHCIATHPSDFAVAMAALDATVLVVGARGERRLPFTELHRLPGDTPHLEHNLAPDEVIEGYRLTRTPLARHSHYLKVRDRGEFEWAICSAAVALELDHGGRIADARVAVGGVATKPWRLGQVETALQGRQATAEAFAEAAALSVQNAVAHGDNAYKLALLPRTIARALTELRERL
ncbi:MAG: xanthine dehydrogenase family protein subunit M [Geminicoccaceae bacterium]|jgi:xanthine dehydrogenase YagS FAD-binding subunit|nr:xanthine dehydrogenase family protein subunit M [Geminicoccaceae bacterium]HRY23845.1 xanthine dehydrogenase family protein subunit M [Geminicoccaceae bacterium]